MADNVKMVPAICTQCGGTVDVDKTQETAAFLKIFGYMMIGMFVFALIAFIILQFTG